MRAKQFVALLTIAAIATSIAITSVPVTAADDDVIFDLTAYSYATYGIMYDMGGYIQLDVYVDASALVNNSPEGMRGWGLTITFDRNVLAPYFVAGTPYWFVGGSAGYFLYDWSYTNWPPPVFPPGPMPYPPTTIFSNGSVSGTDLDYVTCSEMFLDLPPDTGAGGTGKLCTLYFMTLSSTAYTELTIDYEGSGYTEAAYGDKYRAYPVDGHYNMPPNGALLDNDDPGPASFPGGDPTGSGWHEIEPNYCTRWTMTDWTDNTDGKLSPSDQFVLTPDAGGDPKTFHVEWVNPMSEPNDGNPDLFATEKPEVPEFPLGSVAPIALIAAVAYIWWVTRRKRQEAV